MNFESTERRVLPAALAAAALLTLSGVADCAQADWPVEQYNAKAAADDVVLPMPCGGAMAFRRVIIPAADALDDRRVQLGGSDARFAYAENTRSEYVGGGFSDSRAKKQHYFLMGKYEVTQSQYETLSGTCAAPRVEGRLPRTGLTWHEAVYFAGRYGDWLARNAAAKLPSEEGSPGFVRLPTEAEWEYAARGGVAVTDEVFAQPVFPMPDGPPQRYVWYAGTDSSNNELNTVGLLKPNPLGLYDMLGNAGEFVLDPFRLNKHSRLHGQAGGFTVKGGDYRTALADIRTAARTEYVPLDRNGERRDKATGLRLVIVPASLPTPERLQLVRSQWSQLARSDDGASASAGQALADPVKEVEALSKAVTDPALKARIAGVGNVIKANIQSRNEQRDRSAKSEIRVGAYLTRKVLEDWARLREIEKSIALLPEEMRAAPRTNLKNGKEAVEITVSYIVDTIKQLGLDFPSASISSQGEILKREFEARAVPGYAPLIDMVVRMSLGARSGKAVDKTTISSELSRLQGGEKK